jgi:hypothetical protein
MNPGKVGAAHFWPLRARAESERQRYPAGLGSFKTLFYAERIRCRRRQSWFISLLSVHWPLPRSLLLLGSKAIVFAFPKSATRRRLRCVGVYVWFWEKIRVAVLRLERICVSESESAIGMGKGPVGGTQQSCSSNSIFDHLKQVLVFVVSGVCVPVVVMGRRKKGKVAAPSSATTSYKDFLLCTHSFLVSAQSSNFQSRLIAGCKQTRVPIPVPPPTPTMNPSDPSTFTHRLEILSTNRRYHFVDQKPQNYDPAKITTLLLVHGFPDLGWYVQVPL